MHETSQEETPAPEEASAAEALPPSELYENIELNKFYEGALKGL